jgi:peptidoglycan-associated lipoprotein
MKKMAMILVTILLTACGSMSHKTDTAVSQSDTSKKANTGSMTSMKKEDVEANKLAADLSYLSTLQKQSIYFDFDQSVVKFEYMSVIQRHADFIKTHKHDVVTIEGNCDERGSSEYNLALGERRANAAQKNLVLLGVPAEQVKTQSFGNEKPRQTCHEEKCWQENRRDDFSHNLN